MPPPDPHHSLLVHADFLRRLARDLTRDPDAGDDLAQQVWLRALQRPPHHDGALRGWLVRTAQRLWWNDRRGERRRRSREAAVAAPAGETTTPDRILEREAAREEVVRAVMALPEPFRQTLLLHYFDGLRPADIARRLAVPAATVRTRLARGLERVREQLDQQHGDRAAWLPLVAGLPLTNLPTPAALAVPLLMKKLLTTLAALLLLAAGTLMLWSPPPARPDAARDGASVAHAEQAGLPQPSPPSRTAATTARSEAATPAAGTDDAPVYPADRAIGQLRVLVHDYGRPLAGIEVTAEPRSGHLPAMQFLRDDRTFSARATTDRNGECTFADLPAGPVALVARSSEWRGSAYAVISPDTTRPLLLLRADRYQPRRSRTIVRVSHKGQPVAGATVNWFGQEPPSDAAPTAAAVAAEPRRTVVSDAQGIATFTGLEARRGIVIGTTADGLVGRTSLKVDDDHTNALELDRPGTLRGQLVGVTAAQLNGASLEVCLTSIDPYGGCSPHRVTAPITGNRFAVTDLPTGTCGLLLRGAPGLRLADGPALRNYDNSAWLATAEVHPGATTDCELRVVAAARIEGVVRCGGDPVRGARVRAVLEPRTGSDPVPLSGLLRTGDAPLWSLGYGEEQRALHPVFCCVTHTDAHGRYVLDGLASGQHRVDVVASGLTFDTRFDVHADADAPTRLEHELQPAGVLQVATRDAQQISLQRLDDRRVVVGAEGNGVFTLPGLAAGNYQITQMRGFEGTRRVDLGTAEVVAGRTTWLDLKRHGTPVRVSGTVRSGTTPVRGAIVSQGNCDSVTAEDGSFVLELAARPLPFWGHFSVMANGTRFQLTQDESSLTHLDVQLGTRFVEITCRDADDRPAAADAMLYSTGGAAGFERFSAQLRTDPDGTLRLGPLPEAPMQVSLGFANGYRFSTHLDATATAVEVRQPHLVALTVLVERDGAAVPDITVTACRWQEPGPPPEDEQLVTQLFTGQEQRASADANGVALLQVEPGRHLVVTIVPTGLKQLAWSVVTVPDAATHEVTVTGPAR